jgi:ribosomal protein L27
MAHKKAGGSSNNGRDSRLPETFWFVSAAQRFVRATMWVVARIIPFLH